MTLSLFELLDDHATSLLEASSTELIERIGLETVRTIVLDVLQGRNLRDSTEVLTRRRLATLNLATVAMILRGIEQDSEFVSEMPRIAERILKQKRLSKSETWIAQWALGLTGKASQNVLRDDASLLSEYRKRYEEISRTTVERAIKDYGELNGKIYLNDSEVAEMSWEFMVYLLGMIGSQTLTIRGSEKSLYGKTFERFVLGSLLQILGFEFADSGKPTEFQNEFWLSSTGDRESDATALVGAGKGARFDIGFIGRGNTEISLDKVSRFAREVDFGRSTWFMATVIIVDRIGPKSNIRDLAKRIDGDVVQMSMAYWPQEVAQILHKRMAFEHPLVFMPRKEVHDYLSEAINNVDLENYLRAV
ncbi:MAG: CfrBI family restriction endonuclease [Anaerolineae bacterium]|nr:CfrBI family restriction endonuclease [Anaerolineae bacterium]MCO5194868.1 CfrBI family restriction endonuclease [Anaerolineae bacterium]MCO5196824.1 CfrBI family restriction endonuclease [Anaerolineae bacterium]MCO5207830.1 CfrBI family restriction endonuclease [Anaerolineae bacterium]